jgi:DNA polymerase-3 subunit gamma/tau
MSYLALARRYRPADFEQIQSQGHVTRTLQNAIKTGRISHAYLFCGPRGTGKTTTARVLAKALNCVNGPSSEPCGNCYSCREIALGSSPDVFEIDAASNRGIDDIRELRENVRYTPVAGRYKIYIVDEVHRLTKEAFDALLKTLEEPPSHVVFIFATTDPQALPATILSRTQRYDFKRIPVASLAEAVSAVAVKEGLVIDPQAAMLVAKKADGSFRDALSLLDQLSGFADGAITAEQAAEVLGLVKTEYLAEVVGAIIGRRIKDALDKLGDYMKSGGDPQELADALTGYVRTLLLVKSGVEDIELLELDQSQLGRAKEIVADADIVDLLRYFTVLADYKGAVKQGQDPVYSLEAAMVKMSSLDNAVSLQSLLSRLPDIVQGKGGGPVSGQPIRTSAASSAASRPAIDREFKAQPKPSPIEMEKPLSANGTAAEPNQNGPTIQPLVKGGALSFELVQGNWDGFCDSVKKNKMSMFAHLRMCNPSQLDGNILTILVESPNNFQLEQLSRADNKRFLEDSLKGFFGSEIRLKLTPGKSPDRGGGTFESDSGKLFNGTPGARELFDNLGGEIIGQ